MKVGEGSRRGLFRDYETSNFANFDTVMCHVLHAAPEIHRLEGGVQLRGVRGHVAHRGREHAEPVEGDHAGGGVDHLSRCHVSRLCVTCHVM